ncbi:hypothetical protein [Bradyrhizobium australafricanum]|uniref:hypothetical protein n=1 Tax=Bradyrhizobium australafricanum TaxID=2821406 RepID=UPI001CE314F8|nr:hypothetical protein [Bradyrhizobium australafricanum]
MRRDRKGLLSELNRERGRNLTAKEFEAVANLTLAEEFGNVKLANSFAVGSRYLTVASKGSTEGNSAARRAKGDRVADIHEEHVFWNDTFYAETFDFRGQIHFARFDGCTFMKCTIVLENSAEQLAFTGCAFTDCNIDHTDEAHGVVARDNFFDRPIAEREADLERRLAESLNRPVKS